MNETIETQTELIIPGITGPADLSEQVSAEQVSEQAHDHQAPAAQTSAAQTSAAQASGVVEEVPTGASSVVVTRREAVSALSHDEVQMIEALERFAADPTLTLMDLFPNPDGTGTRIGTTFVPNHEQALDVPPTLPMTATKFLPNKLAKLIQLREGITKDVRSITKNLNEQASKLVRKQPLGKQALEQHNLTVKIVDLRLLPNPMGLSNGLRREAAGKVFVVRIMGSAVAPVEPGQDVRTAAFDLERVIVDHSERFSRLLDLPAEKIKRNIQHLPAAATDKVVMIGVRYSFATTKLSEANKLVEKLQQIGQLPMLDPINATVEQLRANA